MSVIPNLRPGFRRAATDDASTSVAITFPTQEKHPEIPGAQAAAISNDRKEEQSKQPIRDAQRGVQDVQAVTLTWSRKSLIVVFIL